jgi:hypothetical protein
MLHRTEAKNAVPNISLPERKPLFTCLQGAERRVNGATHSLQKRSDWLEGGEDRRAVANHRQRQSLLGKSIIDCKKSYIVVGSIEVLDVTLITKDGISGKRQP